jgi:hypothetical protein
MFGIDYLHSFHTDFLWTTHNWPCSTDAVQSALPEMVDTLQVVPVPAYEFDSGLMYPTHYKRMLTRALVELHFMLTHSIADKGNKTDGNDVYTLELYSIRVFKKPLPAIVSPCKRKVSTKDPMESGSPMKKSKPTN